MTNPTTLKITKIGSGGDGVATGPDGPVYVPLTLPGEVVVANVTREHGRLVEVIEPSPDRNTPVCRHFTHCGGCTSQHMPPSAYTQWKRSIITSALANRAIEAPLDSTFSVGLAARRRAVLTAKPKSHNTQSLKSNDLDPASMEDAKTNESTANDIVMGFHSEGTHEIVDMIECPVLTSDIVEQLPRLRELVAPIVRHVGEIRISVLSADNGLDVNLTVLPAKLPRAIVARLCAQATTLGAIRVTMDHEPIFSSAHPKVQCGPAGVIPPPGVFLQASKAAEDKMVELILDNLPKRTKRVADLFCGLGAFAFPLATRAIVSAFDSDTGAISAFKTAIRHTKGIKRVDAKLRDLFQEPLSRKELEDFDAVIFDPPRAGAKHQATNLAKSKVPVVIALSCNPATFARDARALIDGGYSLQSVTPIDQFIYAAHIELVAVFRR